MVTLTLKKKPGAGADSSPRYKPLRSSGLRKVKDGVTTIDEVVRETVK